jgi:hypothetical protein
VHQCASLWRTPCIAARMYCCVRTSLARHERPAKAPSGKDTAKDPMACRELGAGRPQATSQQGGARSDDNKVGQGIGANCPVAIPDLDGDWAGADGRRRRDLCSAQFLRLCADKDADDRPNGATSSQPSTSSPQTGLKRMVPRSPPITFANRTSLPARQRKWRRSPGTSCSCGMVPAAHISTGRTSSK